jgi:glycopeptide antibiotics resistance protein
MGHMNIFGACPIRDRFIKDMRLMLFINLTIISIGFAALLSFLLAGLRYLLPGANSDIVFLLVCLIGAVLGAYSINFLKSNSSLESQIIRPGDLFTLLLSMFIKK